MTVWTSREQLGSAIGAPATLRGVVLAASSGPSAVGLTPDALEAAVDITARTLASAGVGAGDRVLTALAGDADGALVLGTALQRQSAAVTANGPRGRMRLHRLLGAVRPNVLVTTPTGAMDLLARMHMEFLIEPEDLGIEHLVVTGEIATPGTYGQLSAEFGCRVTELWCDPAYGVALAHRDGRDAALTVTEPELVALAAVDRDELAGEGAPGPLELVVLPRWSEPDLVLRTGWTAAAGGAGFPSPTNTVGDLVLVRGRWVSVQSLQQLFTRIDGLDHWSLEVRRDGTLDSATVHVAFGRDSLVGNPMWAGRVDEALRQATPVRLASSIGGTADWAGAPTVDDRRGQHLGIDRAAD